MKKNFIYNVAYQLLILVIPLVSIPYVSRTIGAQGVGVYSYTFSIAFYFGMAGMLGVNNYGNRTIAAVRDKKSKLSDSFWDIYYIQLFFSFLLLLLFIAYVLIFSPKYNEILLIQSITIAASAFDINWFFFGLEKFKQTILRNIIVKALTLIAILVFVNKSNGLVTYTYIIAFSMLVSQLFLWPTVFKYIKFNKPNLLKSKQHIRPLIILFIPVIAVSAYMVFGKIILGSLSSTEELGFFENSAKLISIPILITTALGTIMLPRASNAHSKGEDKKMLNYLEKSMKFIIFISIPSVILIIGLAETIVPILFGPDFTKSSTIAIILAPIILFASWANVIRTQYLIPLKKDRDYVLSVIYGAIIGVSLGILLAPHFGSIGSAIALLLAEITVSVHQTFRVKNRLPVIKYLISSYVFIFGGIIMLLTILLFKNIVINQNIETLIQVILAIGIYSYITRGYIFNDLLKIKNNT